MSVSAPTVSVAMAFSLPQCLCPGPPEIWNGGDFSACFEDLVFGVLANLVTLSLICYCYCQSKKQIPRTLLRCSSLTCPKWLGCIAISAVGIGLLQLTQLFLANSSTEYLYYTKLHRASDVLVWVASWWFLHFHYIRIVQSGAVLSSWWIVRPALNVPQLLTYFLKDGWSAAFVVGLLLTAASLVLGTMTIVDRSYQKPTLDLDDEEGTVVAEPLLQSSQGRQGQRGFVSPSVCFLWDFWTFGWFTPLMNLGLQRQLLADDLFPLPTKLSPEKCSQVLWIQWVDEQKRANGDPSLFRAIYFAYGWDYLKIGLLKIVNDVLGFSGPLLLNVIVKYLETGKVLSSCTPLVMGHLVGILQKIEDLSTSKFERNRSTVCRSSQCPT